MSARARNRTRHEHPPTDPADFAELAALWGRLGAALARDTASSDVFTKDRHGTGTTGAIPASANLSVVRAVRVIRAGARTVEAQVVTALNLDPGQYRSVADILAALPAWRYGLLMAHPVVARTLTDAAKAWLLLARRALQLTTADVPLGADCPDHRDTWATPLMQAGATATLAASLVTGPPDPDWDSDGRTWAGVDAWTWDPPGAVYCPHCGRTWSSTADRRMLARVLNAAAPLPAGLIGRITG